MSQSQIIDQDSGVAMKAVNGIYIPATDEHFTFMLPKGPIVDGRGTYQFQKYLAAKQFCRGRLGLAVDIGGHVGLWARVMAMDFKRVVSFEPLPQHIACYKRNMQGVQNAELREIAMSNMTGTLAIHMPSDNTGHAHALPGGENDVPCGMLDDQPGIVGVDFLKIDVEGFEAYVLEGAMDTIKRDRPVIIIEQKPKNAERYGLRQHDAVGYLQAIGMKQAMVISGDHIMIWPK